MSKVDSFVAAMKQQTDEAINATIQVICDKYTNNEEDREEIRRAIMGAVYMAEGMGHLNALHEVIVAKREEKNVEKKQMETENR